MGDWAGYPTGTGGVPPISVTIAGSRMLYWPSISGADKLTVKRSADEVAYAAIAELECTDLGNRPIFVYEIGDTGYYKITKTVNGVESDVANVRQSDVVPTPDSLILRMVRRCLGEIRSEIDFTDNEIREACEDILLARVNLELGKAYGMIYCIDETTGTRIPVGVSTEMSRAEILLLGYAAGMALMQGIYADVSRNAISTDSPSGRINTTTRPGDVKGWLDAITVRYEAQCDLVNLQNGNTPAASFLNTTYILSGRGYPTD